MNIQTRAVWKRHRRRMTAGVTVALLAGLIGCAVPLAMVQARGAGAEGASVAGGTDTAGSDAFVMYRPHEATGTGGELLVGTAGAHGELALRTVTTRDVVMSERLLGIEGGKLFMEIVRQKDGTIVDLRTQGQQGAIIDMQTGAARQVALSDKAFKALPVLRAGREILWKWSPTAPKGVTLFAFDLVVRDAKTGREEPLWEKADYAENVNPGMATSPPVVWLDDDHLLTMHSVTVPAGEAVRTLPAAAARVENEVVVVDLRTKGRMAVGNVALGTPRMVTPIGAQGDAAIMMPDAVTSAKNLPMLVYVVSAADAVAGKGKIEQRPMRLGAFTADRVTGGGDGNLTVDVLRLGGKKVAPVEGYGWAAVQVSPDGRRVVWKELERAPYPIWTATHYMDSQSGVAREVVRTKSGQMEFCVWTTRAALGETGARAGTMAPISAPWSFDSTGSRARVQVVPVTEEFRRAGGLALEMRLLNSSLRPLPLAREWLSVEFAAQVGTGKPVRLIPVERPIVEGGSGEIAPGATLAWTVHLERMEGLDREQWVAGQTVKLEATFHVKRQDAGATVDAPQWDLVAPAVTIKLGEGLPAELKAGEIPEKWSQATALVYEERGMFLGSNWLSVDGAGHAVLIRSRSGRPDAEIPPGMHQAMLSAEDLASLAAVLREQAYGVQRQPSPMTDQNEVTALASVGGAVARLRYEEPAEKNEPALAHLREVMRKIMVKVASPAAR